MVPPWETQFAPLGLAYIAEYLKLSGFTYKIIDFNLKLYQIAEENKRVFWDVNNLYFMQPREISNRMFGAFNAQVNDFINEILSFDTKIIGFSVNMASIGLAGKIATQIKKEDEEKLIIFGGPGCFWEDDRKLVFPEDIPAIDAFVIGEGEEVLGNIINRKNKELRDIGGVVYKKEDFFKPARPYYTKDIDKLPFPRFSDFDLNGYKKRCIPMLISRGCIGRCTFCIDHLMCGLYRYRSPEKIIEEVKYHSNTNNINSFSLNDLLCNGNLGQLEKFCDLVIKCKLYINWSSYAMIRKDMSEGLLSKMRKAGCSSLCYGIESGSDYILKRMNKFYSSSEAEQVIRSTYKAGITPSVNIIVGFPGETQDNFNETITFVKRNKKYISEVTNVSSCVIMPPSRLGADFKNYGIQSLDPVLYVDENGVDFDERVRRVRKIILMLNALGIKNAILNQPGIRRNHHKSYPVLLSLPPQEIDTPSPRIARMSSCLQDNKFNHVVYDFNIKLYNSVGADLKYLWDPYYRSVWNFPDKIFGLSDLLLDKIFDLTNGLISQEGNLLYFFIEKENFVFSVRIAAILKKWLPVLTVVFVGNFFNNLKIEELIPEGAVDIFITDEEEKAFLSILENNIARDADGIKANNKKTEHAASFNKFNLDEYYNLRLPVAWTR